MHPISLRPMRPAQFGGQGPLTAEQKVKQAAEPLRQVLPTAKMVEGIINVENNQPEIWIVAANQAALDMAKSTLVNTPHVTQNPQDLSLSYRGYTIKLVNQEMVGVAEAC